MKSTYAMATVLALSSCATPNDSTGLSTDSESQAIGSFHTPASTQPGAKPYTLFESGQVRPLALSPDGNRLYAVNTPDNRLEIYAVGSLGLFHLASVPVGLEPVAVAARSNDEVWVVNHLSDSVSIVDVRFPVNARVVKSLLVGDEPRDIVFAGNDRRRAFITTAHRGQNIGFDPQLATAGVGRSDVWVFDANHLGYSLGGNPLTVVQLFSDTPRALAVSKDGSRVYVAAFQSGNRTTTVDEHLITANGGLPPPFFNANGDVQPNNSLIVRHNGTHWVDELGRNWDSQVKFSLPDKDVFVLNANANPPTQLSGAAGSFSGVGTVLYNMVVNPVNGKVYVTNTEALNEQRFEGPGTFAGHSVQGRFIRNQITVLGPSGVQPRHLNKHINYGACCATIPNAENDKSLALPTGMAISSNGVTLYVAALGSSKIGVYNTAQLEADTFIPSTAAQIQVSGGGPTGLVLDEPRHRLYVLTRFDNAISVLDTNSGSESAHVKMHNPEPLSVTSGRRFLYDASISSSHGDTACASCHVFGDVDHLAWDLGDPNSSTGNMPGPFAADPLVFGQARTFASLKGPMTTQSLRGMANHGPMHWRGDRTGGNDAPSAQPNSGTFDEDAAFKKFNVAFPGLLGRGSELAAADMQAFTNFVLQLTYPPNPVRNLDNSLTAEQNAGRDFFFHSISEPLGIGPCVTCHVTSSTANAEFGVAAPGFFGTDGRYSFEPEPQPFKIPHLRNMYTKVGMFGMAANPVFNPRDFDWKGDQIRGFGFLHDGSHDTLFRFHDRAGFNKDAFGPGANPGGFLEGPAGVVQRRQVEAYLFAFDSNQAPIVGQQITLASSNWGTAGPRIDLLKARADAGECDLIVQGKVLLQEAGYLYIGNGLFKPNRQQAAALPDLFLRLVTSSLGAELTYTCVPPGSGHRIALDRDGDGTLNGDEILAGTDPADASSHP